jgi:hypothetical protein
MDESDGDSMDESDGDSMDEVWMDELYSHIQQIATADSESSLLKIRKRARNNEFADELMLAVLFDGRMLRDEKSLRRRWDEPFMRDLATKENSWIREVRLDQITFDLLSDMLEKDLAVDERMAAISSKSGI